MIYLFIYFFRTADSKLNNFTRLEPTLHLLGIPFDTNIARDIMTEKQGVATRLMYQLFIALNNKQKANLTGAAIETMRPAAPVKLENLERPIYQEVMKTKILFFCQIFGIAFTATAEPCFIYVIHKVIHIYIWSHRH